MTEQDMILLTVDISSKYARWDAQALKNEGQKRLGLNVMMGDDMSNYLGRPIGLGGKVKLPPVLADTL